MIETIFSKRMVQQLFSLSFIILSFMFSLLSVSAANSNVYVQCSQLNFTSMTPYEANLNSLFTSLVDSASVYNFNKFETSPQGDGVYGLFQCKGDLSSPDCKDCVVSAVSQLKTTCPVSTGGEIQLEGCFVKYDNTSFFGAQDKMEVCRRCGPSIGYNSDVLNRIDAALAYLVGGNGEYFRRGDFGSIQGVAQCVQDLSLNDCQDCLQEASGRLRSECETSTWGDMYLGKCYIRYADQDNVNLPNNGNPSPNNNNPSPNKKNKRRGKGINWKFISQWIVIISSFFTSTGGTWFSNKKANSAKSEAKSAKSRVSSVEYKADIAKGTAEKAIKKAENAERNTEVLTDIVKSPGYGPYGPVTGCCPCFNTLNITRAN